MGAFDRFPRVLKQIQDLDPPEAQALADALGTAPPDFMARFPPFDLALSEYAARQKRGKRQDLTLLGHVWALRGDEHFILRHTTQELTVERIAQADILTFTLGAVLLHDWIELEVQGRAQTPFVHLDFNAVGLDWIEPIVNHLRVRREAKPHYAPQLEAQIEALPYKWQTLSYTHAREFGQAAQQLLYEPSVPPRWLRRSGREGKFILLMPQHFVLVREPLECYPYGYITKSCLRSNIRHARVATTEQTAALELALGADDCLWRIELPRKHTDALQTLAEQLNQSVPLAA